MFGCECWCWNSEPDYDEFDFSEPRTFSLPSPLPIWPQGQGFGTGRISLGEIEVAEITSFKRVWTCKLKRGKKSKSVSFYKPVEIPKGFFCLGYFSHSNEDDPVSGSVLVGRELGRAEKPALTRPESYSLVWSQDCRFWKPNPPKGYKAMGFLVTSGEEMPGLDEIRCVREDLTETCEASELIFSADSKSSNGPFWVWSTEPRERGMWCRGVPVGTFFCSGYSKDNDENGEIVCLKNANPNWTGMPNLDQIHALIEHYGPTLFFHPDETYLGSSVEWFFENGALLYRDGSEEGEPIDPKGLNLPKGESNDGGYWLDLPLEKDQRSFVKCGNMESSKLYVHVKPAHGGAFTDIAMWVFCPFNGPSFLRVGGFLTIALSKIGEHIGDWEHYTLRLSNFDGELRRIYFSEHSGGRWVEASELEFIAGNKAVVYASKHGHASFPHSGTYIQGSSKLGIGMRNDVDRSENFIDSSTKYEIVAAEYLGHGVVKEPNWLQYMREWGPAVVYDSRSELDKLIDLLPFYLRFSVADLFDLFPTELYGEEGPTGPKEKDNWVGDER